MCVMRVMGVCYGMIPKMPGYQDDRMPGCQDTTLPFDLTAFATLTAKQTQRMAKLINGALRNMTKHTSLLSNDPETPGGPDSR